ncbi:MAG TPA: haloacid dehalogenase type II [Alphaproteobacteria bacterium]|jgi:2-haloacid dehalogenase
MLDPAAIKALTFDVFGTVVDWRGSIARDLGAYFAARTPPIERDWAKFADAWRGKYQPAMERVRSGNRGFVKLDVLHRENLIEVLAEFKIANLSDSEIDHLNHVWHRLDPWPDSIPGMTRLRRRYALAALSNGNVSLIVAMAKRAGIPWDAVLGAETARAYKPQPQAYLRAAEMLSLAPAQCLMVAAHNADLAAAARCGFRTAFVRRPDEIPGKTYDLVADGGVDLDCADVNDLADKLAC